MQSLAGASDPLPDDVPDGRAQLRGQVYEALKRAFMTGRVTRGQKLPVRPLAAILGTSPMPVREALRRLAELRCVTILPNGSAMVPAMTREEFDHICALRLLNEGYCAFVAATAATDEDLGLIDQTFADVEHAARVRDFDAYIVANYRFHFSVYRAARSEMALRFVEGLWLRSGTFIHAMRPIFAQGGSVWHDGIADAMRRRDAEAARKAVEADLGHTFEWMRANARFDEPRTADFRALHHGIGKEPHGEQPRPARARTPR